MHLLKKIIITMFNFFLPSLANQSVEEIIKGRKAKENYLKAVLLKSKIEEAKPLMKKISDNYLKLLDYFSRKYKRGI